MLKLDPVSSRTSESFQQINSFQTTPPTYLLSLALSTYFGPEDVERSHHFGLEIRPKALSAVGESKCRAAVAVYFLSRIYFSSSIDSNRQGSLRSFIKSTFGIKFDLIREKKQPNALCSVGLASLLNYRHTHQIIGAK